MTSIALGVSDTVMGKSAMMLAAPELTMKQGRWITKHEIVI